MYNPSSRKKKIVVSFDWHNDRRYRNLLSALSANTQSEIEFEDLTPVEIQSSDVARIKAVLSQKIGEADYLLTLVGDHANSFHPDRALIGERNWQWWEIVKAKEKEKKLIAVKIERSCTTPQPLLSSNAKWARSYNVPAIISAIQQA